MLISGINRFSLIDYPGQVSCIVFTPGCNFRCCFCHNDEFVLPEKLKAISEYNIKEKAFFNFLKERQGLLTGVSICGGEPTLQSDLCKFCKKVKDMGFLVKLDTNGRSPETIKTLIDEKLVDYVAMDIKHQIGKFSSIVGVNVDESIYIDSINILLNSDIDYEFRTTVIKGIHDKTTIENITKFISGAKAYYLQNYKSGGVLDPEFRGESFGDKELTQLKRVAKKYIKNVGIRN